MSNSTGGNVRSDKSETYFDSFQTVEGRKIRNKDYPVNRSRISSGAEFLDASGLSDDTRLYLTLWGFGEDSFHIHVGIGGAFLGDVGSDTEERRAIERYERMEAALESGRYQLQFLSQYRSIGRPGKIKLIFSQGVL